MGNFSIKTTTIWGSGKRIEIDNVNVFNGVSFVSRAVSTDKDRGHTGLTYMYYNKPDLVGVDGHRLHIYEANLEELEDNGYYFVISRTKTQIHIGYVGQSGEVEPKYLDYTTVIPNKEESIKVLKDKTSSPGFGNLDALYSSVVRNLPDEQPAIKFKFIKDLEGYDLWDVYIGEGGRVLFDNHNLLQAVIMPMRPQG